VRLTGRGSAETRLESYQEHREAEVDGDRAGREGG